MAYLLAFMDMPTLAEDIAPWTMIGTKGNRNNYQVQLSKSLTTNYGSPASMDATLKLFVGKSIPSYVCPSNLNTEVTDWGTATASYAGSLSTDDSYGFFPREGRFRVMGEITDGLTYTIAVSEAGTNGLSNTAYSPSHPHQPQWIGSPHGNWQATGRHADWYKSRQPTGGTVGNRRDDTFSSGHPGGVHCLAADGGVHFVSDRINLLVWSSLATIKRYNGSMNINNSWGDANWYDHLAPAGLPGSTWKPGTGSNWMEIQAGWEE